MQLQRAKSPPVLALELFIASGWSDRLALLQGWTYRFGASGAIHLLDDPAWLALMFC
jgi:hypothetical protein